MLPDMAGGAGHHVERAWLRVERETFPLVAGLTAETEFAGRGEGEPEYLIEVLFVAMPADAGADTTGFCVVQTLSKRVSTPGLIQPKCAANH